MPEETQPLPELVVIEDKKTIAGLSDTLTGLNKVDNAKVQMSALQTLLGVLGQTENQEVIELALGVLSKTIEGIDNKKLDSKVVRTAVTEVGNWGRNQNSPTNKIIAIEAVFKALSNRTDVTWAAQSDKESKNPVKMSIHDLAIDAIMNIVSPVVVTDKDQLRVVNSAKEKLSLFALYCSRGRGMTPLPNTPSKALEGISRIGTLQGVTNIIDLNIAPVAKTQAPRTK